MKRRFLQFLLCSAFLLGQFASIVHATQHELAPDRGAPCEICAIAHLPGPPTAVVGPHFIWQFSHEVPARVALPRLIEYFAACPPATGPPHSLA